MRALSLLIKPASGHCNMRCTYCFYADVTESRSIKNHGFMSPETLELIVRKALSEATESCVFGFQGGEPTLIGLDFYKKLLELERKYNIKNIKISHSLQTNGLLLDEEWAKFFKQNNFLIGLSIDSKKQVHDSLRFDASGKGTHKRCLSSARMLHSFQVEFNILSVITQYLASHPEQAYLFYKQNDFRFIQFIPCLDSPQAWSDNEKKAYSLDAKKYGKFLCRIFDLWYADFIKNNYISIRTFDNYIQMQAGYPPESCAMAGVCSAYALIEADGSVYPCDFYAVDEFYLGNLTDKGFAQMLTSEKAEHFMAASRYVDPNCQSCGFYNLCRGGCRRNREPIINGNLSRNHLCEAYKIFFSHSLNRMKEIAHHLRAR